MSSILFNQYGEYLMKEALAEVGDLKIGGRIIKEVRLAVWLFSKISRRATRYGEQIGRHWKEVWHGNQH